MSLLLFFAGAPLAAGQTVRAALVNTMSEVPPMAHYPRKARSTTSWLETGDYCQAAWVDSRTTKQLVSPVECHLFDDGGVQQSTLSLGSPSGWAISEYTLAVDNDELDWEVREGSTALGNVRPFHGYYLSGAPEAGSNEGQGVLSADVGPDKRHVVAYFNTSGEIVVRIEDNALSLIELVETGIAADWVEIRIAGNLVPNEVRLYTEESGAILRRVSRDGGRIFGSPVTVAASGMKPTACLGFGGTEFVYWISGAGPYDIKGRRYDPALNALEAEFTAVSGVDNEGLAAVVGPVGQTGRRVVLRYYVGGVLTTATSRDGVTF